MKRRQYRRGVDEVVLTRNKIQWTIAEERCKTCGNRMRVSVMYDLRSCSFVDCASHRKYQTGKP